MDFGQSLGYIFEDKDVVSKLVTLAFFMALATIPLAGLPALAIALGYMLEIVAAVRNSAPRPLPEWVRVSDKLRAGAILMLAWFGYHLPLLLLNVGLSGIIGLVGGGFLGETTAFVALCCLAPLNLIYLLFMWPLLAAAAVEFSETGDAGIFMQLGALWWRIRRHPEATVQWLILTAIANVLLALLVLIPCLGWLALIAFALPWQGHLLGQYGRLLAIKPPRKTRAPR